LLKYCGRDLLPSNGEKAKDDQRKRLHRSYQNQETTIGQLQKKRERCLRKSVGQYPAPDDYMGKEIIAGKENL
jgi:hypothetical protein